MLDRYNELVEVLKKANYDYYVNDNPTLSDNEYDSLLAELEKLEKMNPDIIRGDSPTQNVGSTVIDKFEKIRHVTPLMSIADVFNE